MSLQSPFEQQAPRFAGLRRGFGIALTVFAWICHTGSAIAAPSGGTVVGGAATISQTGALTTIDQQTAKAVINWGDFDTQANETVQFNQPSSAAIVLNRVNSGRPTNFTGQLNANGRVVVVNPNGIIFGKTANVDVAGLTATTADIGNENFMAGNFNFDKAGSRDASVINEGVISVREAGLASLVAPQVVNNGVIEANLGHVVLASGEKFVMDFAGDGMVQVEVDADQMQQMALNTGTVRANGGKVEMTAAAARTLVDSVVKNTGVIEAKSLGMKNGVVVLNAGGANKTGKSGASVAINSGTIDVSGKEVGQTGGTVDILADNVGLFNGSRIDASGDAGGGYVRIGGDFHGEGATPTATKTILQGDSIINANAITTGNGGKVAVWSDDYTYFGGQIYAKGGANSGNGGFVETSGKAVLSSSGNVNASAPNGNAGTWLLDPYNITIQSVTRGSGNTNVGSSPTFASSADSAILTTESIQSALNLGTSVTVTTGVGATAQLGDITVTDAITKTAGGDATLTLSAHNSIFVNANITSTIDSNLGKFGVNLYANNDAGVNGGSVTVTNANIITNGGKLDIGGGIGGASYAYGTDLNNKGVMLTGAVINTGLGAVDVRGHGYDNGGINDVYGIDLVGSSITSTSGAITLDGYGGVSGKQNYGVHFINNGGTISSIATDTGAITITGHGNTSGNNSSNYRTNTGIYVDGASTITSSNASAAGNVILRGYGAAGQGSNMGIYVNTGGVISTSAANLLVEGFGGAGTTQNNYGINLTGAGTQLKTTGTGTLTVNGTGGGDAPGNTSTYNNMGILVASNATISTANAALTVNGTGGYGATGNNGISIGVGAGITTANGVANITGIAGTGGNSSSYHDSYGILVTGAGAYISSTGTSSPGALTISGTGGAAYDKNYGIYLNSGGALSTANAAMTVNGTGGNGANVANYGFNLLGNIVSTGSGSITLNATGKNGAVDFYNDGTAVTIGGASATGNIALYQDSADWGSLAINTSGGLTLAGRSNATTIAVNTTGSNLDLTSTLFGNVNARVSSYTIGKATGTGAINVAAWTPGRALNLYSNTGPMSIGALAMGTNALSIYTNADPTFSANLTGTGAFLIRGAADNTSIGIGDGAAGTLALSNAELGYISNGGWSGITIGHTGGTGTMHVNSYASWNDPLTLSQGASGLVSIDGAQTSSEAVTVNGTTTLAGDITTSNDNITLNGATTLSGGTRTLTGGTATTTLGSTVNGAQALVINNTGGAVALNGIIGGTTALASLTATGATTLGGNVTTTGAQAYNSAVTLGGNSTLTSTGSGNITFASTVNGLFSLALATGGTTHFTGIVGGSSALTSLASSGAGGVTIDNNITTSGLQNYTGAVTLGGNSTLTSTGSGNITFASTVNGLFSLALATGGTTHFTGIVGGSSALTSLTSSGAGGVTIDNNITTSGVQSYTGAVTLGGNSTMSTTNNNITFSNTLNGAYTLGVATGLGTAYFNGIVGGGTALTSLTVTGAASVAGNITTSGAQIYNNAVTLTGDSTFRTTFNDITFGSTVNGAKALAVNGATNVTFGGAVGGSTALTSLNLANFGTTTLNGNVTTTGTQNYFGGIALNNNATLSTTNSDIGIVGGVNGAYNFATNVGTGTLTTLGQIGNTTALNNVTFTGDNLGLGGNVIGTGALTVQQSTANRDINLNNGAGGLSLDTTELGYLSGFTGYTFGSTANTGTMTIGAATWTGPTSFLHNNGAGNIAVIGAQTGTSMSFTGPTTLSSNVTTTGTQTYNNAVTLADNVTLATTNSNITFNDAVDSTDGTQSLTTNVGTATLTTAGAMGGNVSFDNLTLIGDNLTLGDNVIGTGTLTVRQATNGRAINLNDGVAGLNLDGTELGYIQPGWTSMVFGNGNTGNITLGENIWNGAASFITNSGTITVSGAQDFNGSDVLFQTDGGLQFNDTLTQIGTLTVAGYSAGTSIGAGGQSGTIQLDDGELDQLSNIGSVVLGRADGTGTVDIGSYSGWGNLTLLTGNTGSVLISGDTTVSNLNVTGPTTLSANINGSVNFDSAVTLGNNSTIIGNGSGNIYFGSTVDGGYNLSTNAAGQSTIFSGAVGGTTALGTLTTNHGATFNGNVTTTGAQHYISGVTLGTDVTFASGNANISFDNTVNGAHAMTTNAGSGTTTFTGAIGGSTALTSLTASGSGTKVIGNNVTTTGAQSYTGPMTLSGNSTMTTTNSNVTFGGTVNGARTLTVAAGNGTVAFNGTVGNSAALTSVTTTGPTTVSGNMTTTGAQTYNSAVTLGGNSTFATTNSNVTFASTVNGAFAMALATGLGTAGFGGIVGGGTALTSLSSSGLTSISNNITTSGTQSYTGAVTLAGNSTLSTTNNDITFGSTLNGARTLALSTDAGSSIFSGIVGGSSALTSLSAGKTTIGNNITTTGTQSYTGAVTLSGNSTLATTDSNVTFGSTVDGARTLAVAAGAGNTRFTGAVGSGTALTSVSVSGAGGSRIDNNISTTGSQTYTGAVTLGGNTVITAPTTLTFGSTVDGAYNLTATAATYSLGGAWGNGTRLGAVSLTSTNSLTLPAITASSLFARTTGAAADLTLGGNINANAATATPVTLVAARNFDNSGNYTITMGGAGTPRWLIYSTDLNSDFGTLTQAFHRYSCTYGGACPSVPATGNGALYSFTPLLTVTPNGGVTISYGNTLSGTSNALSGYVNGDNLAAALITGTGAVTSNYSQGNNIGNYDLTSGIGTLASGMGYGFTTGVTTSNGLTVNPRAITVTAAAKTKTEGGADPALTYTLTAGNLYGSDGFSGALNRDAGENVGSYAINQNTLTAGINYALSYIGANLAITAAGGGGGGGGGGGSGGSGGGGYNNNLPSTVIHAIENNAIMMPAVFVQMPVIPVSAGSGNDAAYEPYKRSGFSEESGFFDIGSFLALPSIWTTRRMESLSPGSGGDDDPWTNRRNQRRGGRTNESRENREHRRDI